MGRAAALQFLLHAFDAIGTERLAGLAVEALRIGLFGTLDRLGTPRRLRWLYLRSRLGRRWGASSSGRGRRGLSKPGARIKRAHDRDSKYLSHVRTFVYPDGCGQTYCPTRESRMNRAAALSDLNVVAGITRV
jgi:hypothetical protein